VKKGAAGEARWAEAVRADWRRRVVRGQRAAGRVKRARRLWRRDMGDSLRRTEASGEDRGAMVGGDEEAVKGG
jgi:hypothetical protein